MKYSQNLAWKLRESGEPLKAVGINYHLLFNALQVSDYETAINLLVDISLSWSILANETNDELLYQFAHNEILKIKTIVSAHKILLRTDYDFHLGRTLTDIGEYNNALEAFARFLENNGSLKESKIAEVNARIGSIYVKKGEREKGLALIEQSIKTLESCETDMSEDGKDLNAIKKLGAKLSLVEAITDKNKQLILLSEIIKEAKTKKIINRLNEAQRLLKIIKQK